MVKNCFFFFCFDIQKENIFSLLYLEVRFSAQREKLVVAWLFFIFFYICLFIYYHIIKFFKTKTRLDKIFFEQLPQCGGLYGMLGRTHQLK